MWGPWTVDAFQVGKIHTKQMDCVWNLSDLSDYNNKDTVHQVIQVNNYEEFDARKLSQKLNQILTTVAH